MNDHFGCVLLKPDFDVKKDVKEARKYVERMRKSIISEELRNALDFADSIRKDIFSNEEMKQRLAALAKSVETQVQSRDQKPDQKKLGEGIRKFLPFLEASDVFAVSDCLKGLQKWVDKSKPVRDLADNEKNIEKKKKAIRDKTALLEGKKLKENSKTIIEQNIEKLKEEIEEMERKNPELKAKKKDVVNTVVNKFVDRCKELKGQSGNLWQAVEKIRTVQNRGSTAVRNGESFEKHVVRYLKDHILDKDVKILTSLHVHVPERNGSRKNGEVDAVAVRNGKIESIFEIKRCPADVNKGRNQCREAIKKLYRKKAYLKRDRIKEKFSVEEKGSLPSNSADLKYFVVTRPFNDEKMSGTPSSVRYNFDQVCGALNLGDERLFQYRLKFFIGSYSKRPQKSDQDPNEWLIVVPALDETDQAGPEPSSQ